MNGRRTFFNSLATGTDWYSSIHVITLRTGNKVAPPLLDLAFERRGSQIKNCSAKSGLYLHSSNNKVSKVMVASTRFPHADTYNPTFYIRKFS